MKKIFVISSILTITLFFISPVSAQEDEYFFETSTYGSKTNSSDSTSNHNASNLTLEVLQAFYLQELAWEVNNACSGIYNLFIDDVFISSSETILNNTIIFIFQEPIFFPIGTYESFLLETPCSAQNIFTQNTGTINFNDHFLLGNSNNANTNFYGSFSYSFSSTSSGGDEGSLGTGGTFTYDEDGNQTGWLNFGWLDTIQDAIIGGMMTLFAPDFDSLEAEFTLWKEDINETPAGALFNVFLDYLSIFQVLVDEDEWLTLKYTESTWYHPALVMFNQESHNGSNWIAMRNYLVSVDENGEEYYDGRIQDSFQCFSDEHKCEPLYEQQFCLYKCPDDTSHVALFRDLTPSFIFDRYDWIYLSLPFSFLFALLFFTVQRIYSQLPWSLTFSPPAPEGLPDSIRKSDPSGTSPQSYNDRKAGKIR